MALCVAIAAVGGIFLWTGSWWGIGLALVIHANEARRGAVHYMKVGNYWESIKHQIINSAVVGYIGAYLLFVKFGGQIPQWVKNTLEFWT